MLTNPYEKMLKKVEKIEESQSLKDFVVRATCGKAEHKMIIEEDYENISDLFGVYEDMKPLELADLYDYQSLIGRYDGEF